MMKWTNLLFIFLYLRNQKHRMSIDDNSIDSFACMCTYYIKMNSVDQFIPLLLLLKQFLCNKISIQESININQSQNKNVNIGALKKNAHHTHTQEIKTVWIWIFFFKWKLNGNIKVKRKKKQVEKQFFRCCFFLTFFFILVCLFISLSFVDVC